MQRGRVYPHAGGCLRLWQKAEKQAGGGPFCLPAQAEAQATGRRAGQHWADDCWPNSQGKRGQGVSRWPGVVSWQGRAVAWRGHAERELRAASSPM